MRTIGMSDYTVGEDCFDELPAALANVSRIVTVVCMIADIITVITSGKITFFAD